MIKEVPNNILFNYKADELQITKLKMPKKIKLLKNSNSKYSLGEAMTNDGFHFKVKLNKAGQNFFDKIHKEQHPYSMGYNPDKNLFVDQ